MAQVKARFVSLIKEKQLVDEINKKSRELGLGDEFMFDQAVLGRLEKLDNGNAVKVFGVDIRFKVGPQGNIISPFDFERVQKLNIGYFVLKNFNYGVTKGQQAGTGVLCGKAMSRSLNSMSAYEQRLLARGNADELKLFELQKQVVALVEKFLNPWVRMVLGDGGDLRRTCKFLRSPSESLSWAKQKKQEALAKFLTASPKRSIVSLFSDIEQIQRGQANYRTNANFRDPKGFGKTIRPRASMVLNKGKIVKTGNCITGKYATEAFDQGNYYKSKVKAPKYVTPVERNWNRSSTSSRQGLRRYLKSRGLPARTVTRRYCAPTKYNLQNYNPVQYGKNVSANSGKLALRNAIQRTLKLSNDQMNQWDDQVFSQVRADAFRPADTFPGQSQYFALKQQRKDLARPVYKNSYTGAMKKDVRGPARRDAQGKIIKKSGDILRPKGAPYKAKRSDGKDNRTPTAQAGQQRPSQLKPLSEKKVQSLARWAAERDKAAPYVPNLKTFKKQ